MHTRKKAKSINREHMSNKFRNRCWPGPDAKT